MSLARGFFLALILLAQASLPSCAADTDFAIRDGDTVVFLGDSITAARSYGKIIEDYTLLRFPKRKVHFHNAGWGGDTAAGGLARLERDVFSRGATLLTVAYGTNDIGWGMLADAVHKQRYLDSIRGIVEACKKRNVRVFICSAAINSGDPDKTEDSFLQTMCDEGMAIARSLGEGAIDVQRSMRAIQKHVWQTNAKLTDEKRRAILHAADGAHLTEAGQMAMAYAILKGLGAPAEVSAATVDAREAKVLDASGCVVSDVKSSADGVEFDRLDEGLPINFGAMAAFYFWHIPYPQELNRYMLTVKNLADGKYELLANGRKVGTWPHAALDKGINISFATANPWEPGGPWDAQSNVVVRLTEARHELDLSRMMARLYDPKLQDDPKWQADTAEANERIERLQREAARPRKYHFIVRRVTEEKKEPKPR